MKEMLFEAPISDISENEQASCKKVAILFLRDYAENPSDNGWVVQ